MSVLIQDSPSCVVHPTPPPPQPPSLGYLKMCLSLEVTSVSLISSLSDLQIRIERVVFIIVLFVLTMQFSKAEHCHKVTCLPQVLQMIFSISLPCMIWGDFRLFPEIKLKLDMQLALF